MNNCLRCLYLVVLCSIMIGCAIIRPVTDFDAIDLNSKVASGEYVQGAENFIVILDATSSMSERHNGRKKLNIAKDVLSRMNQTIPYLKLDGALRVLGQSFNPFGKKTDLIYGVTKYNKISFENALQSVWHGGLSPLEIAIEAAGGDLEPVSERIAMIIVSDGKDMDNTPVSVAENLKEHFGNRLCIYTVVVGDDPTGKQILDKIAMAGKCGFSVSVDEIYNSEDVADFVEKVFLTAGAKPSDSDGDGVYDNQDKCPNTPRGVAVDAKGCPLDSDGDGVYDYQDKCPDTPRGVTVDAKGCPLDSDGDSVYDYQDKCPDTPKGAKVNKAGCWVLKGLTFETAKWEILPQFYRILDELVDILNENPSMKIIIEGHTDNRGSASLNQKLSENRAQSVMEYLMDKGIDKSRLSAEGHGLSRPVASNNTPEGRSQNRRVELKPIR